MLDRKYARNTDRPQVSATGLLVLSILILPILAYGESDAQPEKSKLVITVITGENESPVPGARVIITGPNDIDRSAKTDSEGKATITKLPREKLTVQVVATGFETAGERVTLSQAVEAMTVTVIKSAALSASPGDNPDDP